MKKLVLMVLLVPVLAFAQHSDVMEVKAVDVSLDALVYEENYNEYIIDLDDGCHYVLETNKDKLNEDGVQVCQGNLIAL